MSPEGIWELAALHKGENNSSTTKITRSLTCVICIALSRVWLFWQEKKTLMAIALELLARKEDLQPGIVAFSESTLHVK